MLVAGRGRSCTSSSHPSRGHLMELPATLLSFFAPTSTICPPCDDFYDYNREPGESARQQSQSSSIPDTLSRGGALREERRFHPPSAPERGGSAALSSHTAFSIISLPAGPSPPSVRAQLSQPLLYHADTAQPSLLPSAPPAGAGEVSAGNGTANPIRPRGAREGAGRFFYKYSFANT